MLVLFLLAAASCGKKAWPAPIVPVLTAFAPAPGTWVEPVAATGSMEPHIHGTDRVILRRYVVGEVLPKGTVVVFNRGDYPRVIHAIVDEQDGSYYLSGYGNRHSDGWFKPDRIESVLVGIIR